MPVLANAPSASASVSSQNAALRTATPYATPLCGRRRSGRRRAVGDRVRCPQDAAARRVRAAEKRRAAARRRGSSTASRQPKRAISSAGDRIRDRRRERAHEAEQRERLRAPPREPVRDDGHRDGIERQRRAEPEAERPQQIERGEPVHVRERQQREPVDQRAGREQQPRAERGRRSGPSPSPRARTRARRPSTRARSTPVPAELVRERLDEQPEQILIGAVRQDRRHAERDDDRPAVEGRSRTRTLYDQRTIGPV